MHDIVTYILHLAHNYHHDGREMTFYTTHRALDSVHILSHLLQVLVTQPFTKVRLQTQKIKSLITTQRVMIIGVMIVGVIVINIHSLEMN